MEFIRKQPDIQVRILMYEVICYYCIYTNTYSSRVIQYHYIHILWEQHFWLNQELNFNKTLSNLNGIKLYFALSVFLLLLVQMVCMPVYRICYGLPLYIHPCVSPSSTCHTLTQKHFNQLAQNFGELFVSKWFLMFPH